MLAGGTFFPTLYGLTLKTLRKDYNYGLLDRDHFIITPSFILFELTRFILVHLPDLNN